MNERSELARLSVVVPCFNEQEVIEMTHRRLVEELGESPDIDLEVIYVDDGSTDGTERLLLAIADADPRVQVVSLTRNFGHQPAVSAGLELATGAAVVVIDADLQDPPEVIHRMLVKWRSGFDVVYGVRKRRKEGLLKRTLYAAFYRLFRRMADIDVPLDSGDFALMDRRVVDVVVGLEEKNRFIRGLRSWAGFRQTGCEYDRAPRAAGTPKYDFFGLVKLAFDGIFSFSTLPLTMIFVMGVLTATGSAIAAVVYLIARLQGVALFGASGEAPGFTTIILAVLFFSGVQLISIGILGEYLGRIYHEAKSRPSYLIRGVHTGGKGGQSETKGEREGGLSDPGSSA